MQYVLGNMLNGGGGLNADGLALDLQFAADKTFSKPAGLAAAETAVTSRKGPSAVFSRASGATFVDSDGLIKWGNENLFTRSEDFTQAIWAKTNVTVTGDNAISPDGTSNADSMFETTANGEHKVTFTPTTFAGPASLSVYAKSIGGRLITIELNSIGGNGVYARINLANGTVAISGAYGTGYTFISASVLSVGNSWYRCTLSATLPSSWTGWFRSDDGSTSSFVGDPTRGLQLWGAQLERHTSVCQYIPTTTSAVYAPRFDHTSAGVCRGLLIEESRTNVALYSGALVNNQGWTSALTSVTSGTGPDGNAAYELSEMAANQGQTFGNSGGLTASGATSVTSGTTYTGSIFLKKVTGSVDWVQITHGGGGFGTAQYANINLSNGTIGNSSGGTARIEAHANNWYRVSWTAIATSTTTTSLNVIAAGIQNTNGTTRTPSYAGNTSNKFLAAMGQFEVGSFATSYIPTTTGSVVRSADVCSITAGAFSGFYNNSAGTMVAVASSVGFATSNNSIVSIDSGTTAVLRLFNRTAQGNRLSSQVSSVLLTPAANYNTANVVYKSAISADAAGADFVIDGTQIPDSYTGASLSADNLKFTGASASTSNNTITSLRYYKKRLPVSKLQALTA
jgi:hypothetical protein